MFMAVLWLSFASIVTESEQELILILPHVVAEVEPILVVLIAR